MPKKEEEMMDDGDKGKYKPKKWKQVSPNELKQMAPQERSKYMAYEEPPKHVAEAMAKTKTRLVELKKQQKKKNDSLPMEEELDKEKHSKLIGQLKAAEARNRLRVMRLRYQANRAEEVKHLIACQPTSLKAVRLQALVPPYPESVSASDTLDSLQRERVETILEDERGLTINRDLS